MQENATDSHCLTLDPDAKKRFVFRLSRSTLRSLQSYCNSSGVTQSEVIRNTVAQFNEVSAVTGKMDTWKLLCPKGAEMTSVWAEPGLIASAKHRAASNEISLNHYIEIALKSTLAAA